MMSIMKCQNFSSKINKILKHLKTKSKEETEAATATWTDSSRVISFRSKFRYRMASKNFQLMSLMMFQLQLTAVIAQMQNQPKYLKNKVKSKFQQVHRKAVSRLYSWNQK